ncbi:MAG: SCO family protein [Rhodocyclaceae bacterium]|nr:SCO family protein [Rhodocyclaceae bacterium]
MLLAMLWPVSARAVTEPTRESVVDASFMQIDEPRFLGSRLQEGTVLTDEGGRDFSIGDLRGKPLILLLSYYGCDGTCPVMNAELARVLPRVERFRLGEDYRVLTVSFDRKDSPASAAEFLARTGAVPPDMRHGWRHAVLKQPDVQSEFAGSVGFRFFWSDAAAAFLHPNVLVFLTPQGRVARYIYGTRMDARNIELAILDADWERISNSTAVFDMLTGACFSYNYAEGRYQWNYPLLAGVGSLVSGILMMILGSWFYRKRMGRANA